MLPPMVVYKSTTGTVYEIWTEGGPDGATYAASQSGWFDMAKFNQWFKIVFLAHIRTLPRDEMKLIIGDNLAAHMSPYVTGMCELHNIRFCFLPENSTHLLQPLDVAVFAPMKRRWREVLSDWKDDCQRTNKNFATLPKKEFPALLRKLMEKDYGESIRSGFESCGIHPFSAERALKKLPVENRVVESLIQQQVLNKLHSMRYDQGPTTQAKRPKKKDKLPAGASLTCLGSTSVIELPLDVDEEMQQISRELAKKKTTPAPEGK